MVCAHVDEEATRNALRALVPKSVKIKKNLHCKRPNKSYFAKWPLSRSRMHCNCCLNLTEGHTDRECKREHEVEVMSTLHKSTASRAVNVVCDVDPNCCVIPEFRFRDMSVVGTRKFWIADILFILTNKQVHVVEIDGDSHNSKGVRVVDDVKEDVLKRAGVVVSRVNSECEYNRREGLEALKNDVRNVLKV